MSGRIRLKQLQVQLKSCERDVKHVALTWSDDPAGVVVERTKMLKICQLMLAMDGKPPARGVLEVTRVPFGPGGRSQILIWCARTTLKIHGGHTAADASFNVDYITRETDSAIQADERRARSA